MKLMQKYKIIEIWYIFHRLINKLNKPTLTISWHIQPKNESTTVSRRDSEPILVWYFDWAFKELWSHPIDFGIEIQRSFSSESTKITFSVHSPLKQKFVCLLYTLKPGKNYYLMIKHDKRTTISKEHSSYSFTQKLFYILLYCRRRVASLQSLFSHLE